MKIIRDGKEIELTSDELYTAYAEQEHIFDIEDIKCELSKFNDDDLMDMYGMTGEQIDPLVNDMAYQRRWYINKYKVSWEYSIGAAISDIVSRHKAFLILREREA